MSKSSFMLVILLVLTSVLRGFAEDRYPLSPDGFSAAGCAAGGP